MMMRSLSLVIAFGAALLAGSGAYAATIITPDTAPSLQQVRMVCDASGRCWNVGQRGPVIGDAYNHYVGRVCMDVNGYPCAWPGSEIPPVVDRGPAFSYPY